MARNNMRKSTLLLSIVSGITLVLLLVNISLWSGNFSLRSDIDSRQKEINAAIRLNSINNELIRMLATASARTNDGEIRNMLARHGIKYMINSPSKKQAKAQSTKVVNKVDTGAKK